MTLSSCRCSIRFSLKMRMVLVISTWFLATSHSKHLSQLLVALLHHLLPISYSLFFPLLFDLFLPLPSFLNVFSSLFIFSLLLSEFFLDDFKVLVRLVIKLLLEVLVERNSCHVLSRNDNVAHHFKELLLTILLHIFLTALLVAGCEQLVVYVVTGFGVDDF